jgi:hypothetical protein
MSCSKVYRRTVNSPWLMGRRMRWRWPRCDGTVIVLISVLDQCHRRRNLAEYEGHLEIDAQLLKELTVLANELLGRVKALGAIQEKPGN